MSDGLVIELFGCPKCGERRIDYLEWITDKIVKCLTCMTEYDPLTFTIYDIAPYPDLDMVRESLYEEDHWRERGRT